MTLKDTFVRELVGRMVKRSAESGEAAAAAANASVPPTAKEALAWAMAQMGQEGGAVTRSAFDAEVSHAAMTVAGVFTQPLAAAKKIGQPYTSACRLLRDVPTGGAYDDGYWRASTDVFDFTVSRHMKAPAEIVDEVDGAPRMRSGGGGGAAQPLLIMHVGDALQEPFWPEGLGINRGMHNTFDACWCANKWLAARESAEDAAVLLRERQQLYQNFTMPMSGKTRRMLAGFNTQNEPTKDLNTVYKRTTLDPTTRYNTQAFGFKDGCFAEWSVACRKTTKYDEGHHWWGH
jgi:hypothetical protein